MTILFLIFILIVSIYCIATFDNTKDPSESGFNVPKLVIGILGLSLVFLYFDSMC